MSWFRLDDQGAFHEKVLAAGNEAYGAWVRAGQWSSGRRLDGFVPRATALSIAPLRVWKRLIEARGSSEHGLVEPVGDDFQIHDFLDWNPTGDEVDAKRLARAEAGRRGGLAKAVAKRKQTPSNGLAIAKQPASNPLANGWQNSAPSPSPSPSHGSPPQTLTGLSPPSGGTPPPEAGRKSKSKPKTSWPKGFAVSAAIDTMCRAEGLPNPYLVFEHFRDKALAKNYQYADWEAAFRGWMRSALTRRDYPPWSESNFARDDDEFEAIQRPFYDGNTEDLVERSPEERVAIQAELRDIFGAGNREVGT